MANFAPIMPPTHGERPGITRDRISMLTFVFTTALPIFIGILFTVYAVFTWPLVPVQVGLWLAQLGGKPPESVARDESLVEQQEQKKLEVDSDQDGLSNLTETSIFNTDQDNWDTDGDGYGDGEELQNGYDPLTPAGTVITDSDSDGLSDFNELYVFGTDPNNKDTDGDTYEDGYEVFLGFSPTSPEPVLLAKYQHAQPNVSFEKGLLVIPEIDVEVPIIWDSTDNADAIQGGLREGVVHYQNTPYPGEPGNALFAGHSSNYAWDAGKYNNIFTRLDELEEGDKFTMYRDGRKYIYTVESKNIVRPDWFEIYQIRDDQAVTLLTCWPIGTSFKRMVVIAKRTDSFNY